MSHGFQDAREATGLPAARFHDLRHSAATLMLAEGVPLAVISEWLGHSGIAITASHYAAIVPTLRLMRPTRWTGRSEPPRPPTHEQ